MCREDRHTIHTVPDNITHTTAFLLFLPVLSILGHIKKKATDDAIMVSSSSSPIQALNSFLLFLGMYFDHPEITPAGVAGDFRFSKGDERVARFASKEAEARSLIEGQFMAKRIHAEDLGFELGELAVCLEKPGCCTRCTQF